MGAGPAPGAPVVAAALHRSAVERGLVEPLDEGGEPIEGALVDDDRGPVERVEDLSREQSRLKREIAAATL